MEISFIVENASTGETRVAEQKLLFQSELTGSRKSPFRLEISGVVTGIDQIQADSRATVYSLDGIMVSRDATLKSLRRLPKGVYIINGRKRFVK